jgi:(1->4)-alpha-D-glucan 1-alpha-D-glucosylmutase
MMPIDTAISPLAFPLETLPQFSEALISLAQAYGVETHFVDVYGQRQAATPTALVQVLHALGVPTQNGCPMACQEALAQHLAAQWQQVLPPYCLVRQGEEAHHTLRLQLPSTSPPLRWQIKLETGDVAAEGTVDPHTLSMVGHTTRPQPQEALSAWAWPLASQLPTLPFGYHTLALFAAGEAPEALATAPFVYTPRTCYLPPALQNPTHSLWGLAVQLYSLCTPTTWGMGDLGTVHSLLQWAAQAGAGLIALNPLHQLLAHQPQQCSPYSPSSRRYTNPLYLEVEALWGFNHPEFQVWWQTPATQSQWQAARAGEQVNYPAVAALKQAAFERLFALFETQAPQTLHAAFTTFCQTEGEPLAHTATYDAFCEHFAAQGPEASWGWPVWPSAYHSPNSPESKALAAQLAPRQRYFQYLQWAAHQQLEALQTQSTQAQLPVGLYMDLAVGTQLGSAEVWGNPSLYSHHASLGCPPDAFNALGQNWGLPPTLPQAWATEGYASFLALLRCTMRYAGALRIDHAVALFRAFWIPQGLDARDGAYVGYPHEVLLGLLALESHRNHCMVVGEDLGTVPEWMRETLLNWQVFSYRLVMHEKEGSHRYKTPKAYPIHALVSIGTHDLPSLQAYWQGKDITLRHELNLLPTPEHHHTEWADRPLLRQALLDALIHHGLMPEGYSHDQADYPAEAPLPEALVVALHRFMAQTPCQLKVVGLEDALGLAWQINLPGTVDQHPNWRQRLPIPLQEALASPLLAGIGQAVKA